MPPIWSVRSVHRVRSDNEHNYIVARYGDRWQQDFMQNKRKRIQIRLDAGSSEGQLHWHAAAVAGLASHSKPILKSGRSSRLMTIR